MLMIVGSKLSLVMRVCVVYFGLMETLMLVVSNVAMLMYMVMFMAVRMTVRV